jgi:FkbM family methyltransferase
MPENVEIFKKKITLSNLDNVILVDKAVGPNLGFVSMRNTSNGMVSLLGRGRTIKVEAVTIDRISEDYDVIPSLLKIDVEGFEYKLFEGCKTVLSHRPWKDIHLRFHGMAIPLKICGIL